MTFNTFMFCVSVAFNIFFIIQIFGLMYRLLKAHNQLEKLLFYECKNCFDYFISATGDKYCNVCKDKGYEE